MGWKLLCFLAAGGSALLEHPMYGWSIMITS